MAAPAPAATAVVRRTCSRCMAPTMGLGNPCRVKDGCCAACDTAKVRIDANTTEGPGIPVIDDVAHEVIKPTSVRFRWNRSQPSANNSKKRLDREAKAVKQAE
jgi:hypothetical protein